VCALDSDRGFTKRISYGKTAIHNLICIYHRNLRHTDRCLCLSVRLSVRKISQKVTNAFRLHFWRAGLSPQVMSGDPDTIRIHQFLRATAVPAGTAERVLAT